MGGFLICELYIANELLINDQLNDYSNSNAGTSSPRLL